MNDLGATILTILLLILIIRIAFLKRNLIIKLSCLLGLTLIMIGIPILGHSYWNEQNRLIYELNHLKKGDSLAYTTDKKAVNEIINFKHPLHIKILSSKKEPFTGGTLFSDESVVINGKSFRVKLACYLYPLNSTLYETWRINSITRIHKKN